MTDISNMKHLFISTRNFNIPEEWHETVEYIASITPKAMHIEDIRLVQDKAPAPVIPDFFLEFDLINTASVNPYTITRKYNATEARQYVDELKSKPN